MSDRKPKPDTVTYLLRNVPAASWRAAQARAEREGLTVRVVLLQALQAYGAAPPGSLSILIQPPPKTKKSPRRPK